MNLLCKSVVAALSTVSVLSAVGQEKKLTKEQLPAPVAATVDRELGGATVKGYATERENGKKVYEAETVLSGHTRDLQIAENGKLNEIEEQVTMESLPAKVRTALDAKAGSAQLTKVESITKNGKLVAYEAATLKGGKKGEIQVGPNGETLTHEE